MKIELIFFILFYYYYCYFYAPSLSCLLKYTVEQMPDKPLAKLSVILARHTLMSCSVKCSLPAENTLKEQDLLYSRLADSYN